MKETWVDDCSTTIQNFVERSTRLQPDKLKLELVEKIDFDYQIGLSLYFRVQKEELVQAGRISETTGTRVYYHAHEHSAALQALSSAVLSRQETLREAQALVLSQPYGAMKKETVIYSHPERLCLTESCIQCHGRGQVNCSRCHGSGRVTCTTCGGSAQVLDQRTYYDNYTKQNRVESYYRTCTSCSGGRVRCGDCSGSGNQRCSPCAGTGHTTRISRLQSVAMPDYRLIYFRQDIQTFIKDGLYKAGITELEKFGTVELADAKIDETSRSVNFLFNAVTPFARFDSPLPQEQVAEQSIHWIVYGKNPQILDAGHVIELMLKSDLNNLVYRSTAGKLLNPLVATLSRKTVSTFMESEAHQDMLDANRAGKSGEALREALNRGVTTTYIDEALTSLKSVMNAIQSWSVVKWTLFSVLIAWLLMPFYTAYTYIWLTEKATGHVFLTPIVTLDNQQNLVTTLNRLARQCGPFIAIAAILLPLIGYLWRWAWVRCRMGKHLAEWAVEKKILRHQWFVSFLMTAVLTTLLLLFFPIWATKDGSLFGLYSIKDLLRWVIHITR